MAKGKAIRAEAVRESKMSPRAYRQNEAAEAKRMGPKAHAAHQRAEKAALPSYPGKGKK